jgi:hypothetical protein
MNHCVSDSIAACAEKAPSFGQLQMSIHLVFMICRHKIRRVDSVPALASH